MATNVTELDRTAALLESGAASIPLDKAITSIDYWQNVLNSTANPELLQIATELAVLRGLLIEAAFNGKEIGAALIRLGNLTQACTTGCPPEHSPQIERLGQVLLRTGRVLG